MFVTSVIEYPRVPTFTFQHTTDSIISLFFDEAIWSLSDVQAQNYCVSHSESGKGKEGGGEVGGRIK